MLVNLVDKVSAISSDFISRSYFIMVLVIRASFCISVEKKSGMLLFLFGYEVIEVSREDISSLSATSQ